MRVLILQVKIKKYFVILNPLSCSEKEYCTFPEENKIINTSIIMSKEKVEGQWKIY